MKPITVALLLAAAGFATTAARADHSRVNVDIGISLGAPVYVESAPVAVVPVGHRHPSRGYWDTVTVKTWIPGRWIATYDRRGRPHRIFERGHYAHHTERVWIDGRGRDNRDYRHAYNGGHRRWDR